MLLWVVASVLFAAVVTPWVYLGGKHLAAVAAERDWGGLAGWLGAACGRAGFTRFFSRSVLLGALALLPPLLRRVRRLKRERRARGETLPKQLRTSWRRRLLLWTLGATVAAVLVGFLGMVLTHLGGFASNGAVPDFRIYFTRALLPAVGVSLAEEALFRGVLLGWWLRVARPATACLGSSLVFAAMHFLSPAPGYVIADPGSALAGFELLRSMLWHYTDPAFFVADFLTLSGAGLVLAAARLRTGSLALPMGLHSGWVFAFKSYNLTHLRLAESPVGPLLVGDSLRAGLLPLVTLALTAACCHLLLRGWERAEDATRQPPMVRR